MGAWEIRGPRRGSERDEVGTRWEHRVQGDPDMILEHRSSPGEAAGMCVVIQGAIQVVSG